MARVARLAADTKLNLPEKKNFTFKKVVAGNLKSFRFDQALIGLWEEISQLDRRINEEKPWELTGLSLKKVSACRHPTARTQTCRGAYETKLLHIPRKVPV